MSLPERNRIELFRGATTKGTGCIETFLCPIDENHSYIGKELVIQDGFKLIYYFVPYSNHEAVLLACIEEHAQLTKAFEDYSRKDLDILEPSFPKMIRGLKNGILANLTNYAILRLESNNQQFDCIATKVTNIDILDLECDYLLNKVIEMCAYASEVIDELDWDRVSFWQKAQIVGNGILSGASTAFRVYKITNLLNSL